MILGDNDIMIGDFVMLDNKFVVKISKYDDFDIAKQGRLTGIDLTVDLMKKFGFKGDGYLYYQLGDGKFFEFYPFEHRLCLYWTGVDEWQNHSKVTDLIGKCHCYYVHELQHNLKSFYVKNIDIQL